jgi:hypothetical protein
VRRHVDTPIRVRDSRLSRARLSRARSCAEINDIDRQIEELDEQIGARAVAQTRLLQLDTPRWRR